MARHEKNDVDYFPFYCKEGASTNYIDEKHGNNGFAVWVKLLRLLAKTDYHYLDLSKKKTLMHVSSKCKVSEAFLLSFLEELAELEEIDKPLLKYKIVYSDKFVESIRDAYKKRNNDLMKKEELLRMLIDFGIPIDENLIESDTKIEQSVDVNTHIKVNESKVNNKIKNNDAAPPSLVFDKRIEKLKLPFDSERFKIAVDELLKSKKWKKKEVLACQKALNRTIPYHEEFVIEILIAKAVENEYQGLVYDDAPESYTKWYTKKNISPAANKPKAKFPNVYVKSLYDKLERESPEQFEEYKNHLKSKDLEPYERNGVVVDWLHKNYEPAK